MRLTIEENEMLQGEYGYPAQKSMEILASLGECYDTEQLLPVTSAHLLASPGIILKGGVSYIKEMADKKGKFTSFTTTNPSAIDPLLWNDSDIGISEDNYGDQMTLTNAFTEMGAFLSNTCTPYLVGHVPRLGQHIGWSESSAVIFANSVLGARTNREGAPSSLAAALTGRVAAYGFHLGCLAKKRSLG